MERYCCNLELARTLQKLGVKQESEFYWVVNKMKNVSDKIIPFAEKKEEYEYKDFSQHYYSAFIAEELGEKLPFNSPVGSPFKFTIKKDYYPEIEDIGYGISYYEPDNEFKSIMMPYRDIIDKKFSHCLAKMLIYLLENKLIADEKIS